MEELSMRCFGGPLDGRVITTSRRSIVVPKQNLSRSVDQVNLKPDAIIETVRYDAIRLVGPSGWVCHVFVMEGYPEKESLIKRIMWENFVS